jgi:phosphopantetheinyl transferase (holo-ACP synthase)
MPCLGNDVVDLREARALAKENDERFLARIFTPAERACIQSARDPALTLWMIWAGKECLFKIASRENPRAIFAHRAFIVPTIEPSAGHELRFLQEGLTYHWEWNKERLHCVVGSGPWESAAEEGAETRALALRILAVPGARIVRHPGPGRDLAPVAQLGEYVLADLVSLSHDGRFAAAAILRSV